MQRFHLEGLRRGKGTQETDSMVGRPCVHLYLFHKDLHLPYTLHHPGSLEESGNITPCSCVRRACLLTGDCSEPNTSSKYRVTGMKAPAQRCCACRERFLVYPHPMASVANTRNFSLNFSYVYLIIGDTLTLTTAV